MTAAERRLRAHLARALRAIASEALAVANRLDPAAADARALALELREDAAEATHLADDIDSQPSAGPAASSTPAVADAEAEASRTVELFERLGTHRRLRLAFSRRVRTDGALGTGGYFGGEA